MASTSARARAEAAAREIATSSAPPVLWRECVNWLVRCKILPQEHKACWPDADIRLLALSLRDGVLLCNLVINLDPASMDPRDFNRKPQMAQFLCCKNIKLFLRACSRDFLMRKDELFEPTMLYDLTDFHRVLKTLSKLSNCRRVRQLHPTLTGFQLQISKRDRSHSDESIYKDLHSTTVDNAACAVVSDENIDHKVEEVYQDLCSLQRSKSSKMPTAVTFEQRDYVIRELLETEANYVEVLDALQNKFRVPLENHLTVDILNKIFPRIAELLLIHRTFIDKLRLSVLPGSYLKMSVIFLEYREHFLIYGEYCSNLLAAMDCLQDMCKKHPHFAAIVQQLEKEYSVGKLQLRDILSVPMQRILKYHLLLDKLVQESNLSHDDYRGLERAREAMIDVSQHINEVKRDSDHMVVIQKVKDSITGLSLLTTCNTLLEFGRLLLDGELEVKSHLDYRRKHRYAFVFDKILIVVQQNETRRTGDVTYEYKESFKLGDYRVEQLNNRKTLTRDARFKYQLVLAHITGMSATTLSFKSESDRNKWFKVLTEAMDNLDPPGCRNTDHKMELYTFEKATSCVHCSKFLKGRIHQGYRCKMCDIGAHKGCIPSTGRCTRNPANMPKPPPVCDRKLTEYYWFVGPMPREKANAALAYRKPGTYMLRVRPLGATNLNETMYAISLKTKEHMVKHMKINQEIQDEEVAFSLSAHRLFKSIVDLVSYYERNDLHENFVGRAEDEVYIERKTTCLYQKFLYPYNVVLLTALYNFEPMSAAQLPLKAGNQVRLIGKEGDANGWWRGRSGDSVGYFPKEFVQEEDETLAVETLESMPDISSVSEFANITEHANLTDTTSTEDSQLPRQQVVKADVLASMGSISSTYHTAMMDPASPRMERPTTIQDETASIATIDQVEELEEDDDAGS